MLIRKMGYSITVLISLKIIWLKRVKPKHFFRLCLNFKGIGHIRRIKRWDLNLVLSAYFNSQYYPKLPPPMLPRTKDQKYHQQRHY